MTRTLYTLIALTVVCLLAGCTPTTECGTWAFNGTPTTADGYPQFPLSSAFTFDPATCGKNCSCTKNCMIQMTWVYNTEDGEYEYPTSSYEARSTSNGWQIDRVDGAAYGYYGLINDGVTFNTGWNQTGSNGKPNTLFDAPSWPANHLFYAVDVSVCFTSATCQNSIQGYYFWSWFIDNNGTPSTFITAPAWKDLDAQFQSALSAWNTWAPSSGSENDGFPGDPTLAHAVAFPTLADL